MSIFSRAIEGQKQGADGSKLWVSWPVRIHADHIHDIAESMSASSPTGRYRLYVNGREINIPDHFDWKDSNPADLFIYQPRFERVRSVALQNELATVFMGPHTAYAFSASRDPLARGVLYSALNVFRDAKTPFGNFLLRTWGAAILVVAALIAALYVASGGALDSAQAVSIGALCGALGIFLLTAAWIGIFRRVRIEIRRGERMRPAGRAVNQVFIGLFVTVVGGLIVLALTPLFSAK